jgi:sugar transferase EpsL
MKRQDLQCAVKRAFDLAASLLGLTLLWPLLGLLALLVRLKLGKPVFFR